MKSELCVELVAQLGERLPSAQEVSSSILLRFLILFMPYALQPREVTNIRKFCKLFVRNSIKTPIFHENKPITGVPHKLRLIIACLKFTSIYAVVLRNRALFLHLLILFVSDFCTFL